MMKKKIKRAVKKPLEAVEEFAKEAKKQITAKAPAPEETLGMGTIVGKKQARKIREEEEKKLRELRMKKAIWLGRYKKIQEEELTAAKKREEKEEEKKRLEELEKKKREEKKGLPSGEEAIAATGTAQKRPTGLWGIGRRFRRLFKWFTPERRGRAPR